ncbi:MAG: transposase [Burkholderiaceae bacterium]
MRGRSYAPWARHPNTREPAARGLVDHLQRHQPRQGALQGLRRRHERGDLDRFHETPGARRPKDKAGKVFLVLDNLKVHHAKLVKAWLEQNKADIEVFYLPSYSPELNPDEMLNANLKAAIQPRRPTARRVSSSGGNRASEALQKSPKRSTVLSEGQCQICRLIQVVWFRINNV